MPGHIIYIVKDNPVNFGQINLPKKPVEMFTIFMPKPVKIFSIVKRQSESSWLPIGNNLSLIQLSVLTACLFLLYQEAVAGIKTIERCANIKTDRKLAEQLQAFSLKNWEICFLLSGTVSQQTIGWKQQVW